MKRHKHRRITITPLEATLLYSGGRTAQEMPDFNGNLPLPVDMPPRRLVSVEEFEAAMRQAEANALDQCVYGFVRRQ